MSHRINYPKSIAIKDLCTTDMPKKRLIQIITKLSLNPKSGDIIPTCSICGKEFRYKTQLKIHLDTYTKEQLIDKISTWRTFYN